MANDKGFAQRLRDLRKRAGFSQTELAQLVGVSLLTIFRWENAERQPRLEEIKKLAEVLHVSESELLNGSARNEWELRLVVSKTKEGGTIDMTSSKSSAVLNISDDAMAITLSAPYELWSDDSKFEELIADLRRKRATGLKTRREDW